MNIAQHTAFRCLTAILFAAVGVASIIASGGGGGGSSFGTTSAQGLWTGTSNVGRVMSGIVLDDGTYWLLYDIPDMAHPAPFDGFIQGTGSTSGNDFSSSDGKDFSFSGLFAAATLAANFAEKSTFDGTFTYEASASEVWNADYDTAFDLTPSLTDIAGAYDGSSINTPAGGNPRTASFTISSTGATDVAGAANCNNLSGTVTTHASGNVYDFSGTISNVDCIPGEMRGVSGIAFFDAGSQVIYVLAVDSVRTEGYFLTGTRQ